MRKLAMIFYGLEYWEDPINVVFGNGIPSFGNSQYGNYINSVEQDLHLYASDVGIVGTFSHFGALYLLAVALLFKKLFSKFKQFPLYVKCIVIGALVNIPIGSWLYPVFFSSILYLSEKNVNSNIESKYENSSNRS